MTNTVFHIAETISNSTNWTTVLSVTSGIFAITFGVINVKKQKKIISEEQLRESEFIKEIKENCKMLEKKYESLKDEATKYQIEIERLKVQGENYEGDIQELQKDYESILNKIDEMLKEIKFYTN